MPWRSETTHHSPGQVRMGRVVWSAVPRSERHTSCSQRHSRPDCRQRGSRSCWSWIGEDGRKMTTLASSSRQRPFETSPHTIVTIRWSVLDGPKYHTLPCIHTTICIAASSIACGPHRYCHDSLAAKTLVLSGARLQCVR